MIRHSKGVLKNIKSAKKVEIFNICTKDMNMYRSTKKWFTQLFRFEVKYQNMFPKNEIYFSEIKYDIRDDNNISSLQLGIRFR